MNTAQTSALSLTVEGLNNGGTDTANDKDFSLVSNLTIVDVQRISKTQSGNPIVVIHAKGLKYGIQRSEKQFLTDLENSFMLPTGATSIMDDRISDILRDLKDGDCTMSATIAQYDANTEYVLDEYSQEARLNPSLIGQKRTRNRGTAITKRGTFVSFRRTDTVKTRIANANAAGLHLAKLFAGFGNATATVAPEQFAPQQVAPVEGVVTEQKLAEEMQAFTPVAVVTKS